MLKRAKIVFESGIHLIVYNCFKYLGYNTKFSNRPVICDFCFDSFFIHGCVIKADFQTLETIHIDKDFLKRIDRGRVMDVAHETRSLGEILSGPGTFEV